MSKHFRTKVRCITGDIHAHFEFGLFSDKIERNSLNQAVKFVFFYQKNFRENRPRTAEWNLIVAISVGFADHFDNFILL